MPNKPLRVSIIGFGKIAAGYTHDALMAKFFDYATHAQVLKNHPAFIWDSVVEILAENRGIASSQWNIPYVFSDVRELAEHAPPDVVVLATPPANRINILKQLPAVKAVLVEKPLGSSFTEAAEFLNYCNKNNIQVQVNLLRRADTLLRNLAAGELKRLVGKPQVIQGLYGNGLWNNGTHMIDLVQMLLGDVIQVQALIYSASFNEGPLPNDTNFTFNLYLANGCSVTMQPLRFKYYRENSLDIWGDEGRLTIMQESLTVAHYPRVANRAMSKEYEIASDKPNYLTTTLGEAFYHMYTNLAEVSQGKSKLYSSGESALQTMQIVEALISSFKDNGKLITI